MTWALSTLCVCFPLAAADPAADAAGPGGAPSGLAFWLFLLAVMALAPFVLTMVTSFAKLVIVGGIVRHALGTQQIPPNTVITGLCADPDAAHHVAGGNEDVRQLRGQRPGRGAGAIDPRR